MFEPQCQKWWSAKVGRRYCMAILSLGALIHSTRERMSAKPNRKWVSGAIRGVSVSRQLDHFTGCLCKVTLQQVAKPQEVKPGRIFHHLPPFSWCRIRIAYVCVNLPSTHKTDVQAMDIVQRGGLPGNCYCWVTHSDVTLTTPWNERPYSD